MTQSPDLQSRAEALGTSLPALLAQAELLASTVMMGEHGRKRAGQGDEFWQYRLANQGDAARSIDWRRSARSDQTYVREREWQAAQSVSIWVDQSRAMDFSGDKARPAKSDCARLVGLALAVLLLRGGERVGLAGRVAPKPGRAQIMALAQHLTTDDAADYGSPTAQGMAAHGRAVFLSDFLGPLPALEAALSEASDRGVKGILLQILDPQEQAFPFAGRTIFESMAGALRHETQSAADLRNRYLDRMAERQERLSTLAAQAGWRFHCHDTGEAPQHALLWAYLALGGGA